MPAFSRRERLLLIGLATGILSSMFGIGGGFTIVPALVLYCNCKMPSAVRTSLALIIPMALAGAITNYFLLPAPIDLKIPLYIVAGALAGSWVGTEASWKFGHSKLARVFALLLLLISLKMLGLMPSFASFSTISPDFASLAAFGFLAGVLSGMFGIGGGVIIVPALNLIFGFPIHQAVLLSLISIIPISIAGVFFHNRKEKIDFDDGKLLALTAVPGAVLGGIISSQLGSSSLQVLFGLLLAFLSIEMFRQRN